MKYNSVKNDTLQRLVRGELTNDEKMGYSDNGKKYATEGPLPDEPKKKVSFSLTEDEKLSIYQDVRLKVINGETPSNIGKAVVFCIEEILREKEKEAYGEELKPGGVFRRTE